MPSTPELIEAALSAVLAAAAAGVMSPVPPVRVRKQLLLLDGDVPPLQLVSTTGREEFEPAGTDASGKKWWLVRYPVAVALDLPVAGKAGENPDAVGWRDAVWAAVADYRNLAGAGLAVANDTTVRGGPAGDPAALARQVERTVLYVTVETLELRP